MAKELGPTTDFQISPPTPGWSQVESRPMGHSSPRQWVGNASTHWVTCIMYSFGRPIAIPNRSENESHSGTQQTRRMQQLFTVCWWLSRSAFCFLVGAKPPIIVVRVILWRQVRLFSSARRSAALYLRAAVSLFSFSRHMALLFKNWTACLPAHSAYSKDIG